ncbi:MAG: NAD-dependent epimerase/dehydratase family protein [bacterium]|jgi:dTDP-L-rhamnose 4-epimerase|nr:NAD-dependent epimerase/dehydratase family protein [bacterium]
MKVLVTGGAGFIGSFIVDELVRKGHQVRIFDVLDPQVHPGGKKPDYLNPDAEFIQGDVRDKDALHNALQGQEIVFHEAAAVGMGQSQYQVKHYVDTNTGGTANLLDLLANTNHSVQKVMVAASQSSYGEGLCRCPEHGILKPLFRPEAQLADSRWEHECPHCGQVMQPVATTEDTAMDCRAIYAITKRDQEDMLMSIGGTYRIPCVALRYFNVYGPRQSLSNPYTGVLAIFMSRLKNGNRPVIYEDALQTRDFISVHDVVQANIRAMENSNADYQIFNTGTGIPTTIKDVALLLAQVYNSSIEPEVTGHYRKGDTRHCFADIRKIQEKIGFQPSVSLVEGMKELVAWSETAEAVDQFETATQELAKRGLV